MGAIAKKDGPEEIMYSGKFLEIVEQPVKIGDKKRNFESARRMPGTRLILTEGDKILLTREHRIETGEYDYRLPGGKVFDSLDEYRAFLQSGGDIEAVAREGAINECREETGLIANKLEYFVTALAGSTVVWDLFYYIVTDFHASDGQDLGEGEDIEVFWKTRQEIEEIIAAGGMAEYRSVGVLYKYFLEQK